MFNGLSQLVGSPFYPTPPYIFQQWTDWPSTNNSPGLQALRRQSTPISQLSKQHSFQYLSAERGSVHNSSHFAFCICGHCWFQICITIWSSCLFYRRNWTAISRCAAGHWTPATSVDSLSLSASSMTPQCSMLATVVDPHIQENKTDKTARLICSLSMFLTASWQRLKTGMRKSRMWDGTEGTVGFLKTGQEKLMGCVTIRVQTSHGENRRFNPLPK